MIGAIEPRYSAGPTPPTWPFALTLLTVGCSVALALDPRLISGTLISHITGWACGSFLPIWFVIGYRLHDRRLRKSRNYTRRAHSGWILAVLTVLGLAIGGYHGWLAAEWMAS
ncbi:hypothetical protein [Actinocrispum sp. NPDC049592]|uniref:hypothetical protein n=1 Tax=Actinocrispum sp. NPDC049592 TaxID=3154835 RepID=UPI003415150C